MRKVNVKAPKFKKLSMNFPTELYNDIKELALKDNLTFTAEIVTLCRRGIEQSKTVEMMPKILEEVLKLKNVSKK